MNLLGRVRECAALDRIKVALPMAQARYWCYEATPAPARAPCWSTCGTSSTDWRVLSASGVESETDLAYSGLHQLLTPLIDKHLDRLPIPQRDALATALGVATRFTPGPVSRRAGHALAAGRRRRPTAPGLSDRRRAVARPSLDQVLTFVARRLLVEPIALVCATRTGQEVEILVGLPELAVHGLSDTDARTLLLNNVHGPVDSAVVDQIVTESHGNPLALLELPRAWQASDLAGGFGLPDTATTAHKIERSYVRRLSVLPAETQLLVLAAAAEPLGDPMLLSRAAGLLGTDLTVSHPAVDVGSARAR